MQTATLKTHLIITPSQDFIQKLYREELSQDERVKRVLEAYEGQWISVDFFQIGMRLSQTHRILNDLREKRHIKVEASKGEFSDLPEEEQFIDTISRKICVRLPIKNTLF